LKKQHGLIQTSESTWTGLDRFLYKWRISRRRSCICSLRRAVSPAISSRCCARCQGSSRGRIQVSIHCLAATCRASSDNFLLVVEDQIASAPGALQYSVCYQPKYSSMSSPFKHRSVLFALLTATFRQRSARLAGTKPPASMSGLHMQRLFRTISTSPESLRMLLYGKQKLTWRDWRD
jgi:hypothetical protein